MRTETRYRQVAYEVYITSDGKEYSNKDDANHHEKELKGDIKKCSHCNGTGKLNARYVDYRDTYSMGYEKVLQYDKCQECNGKGYLEKKTTWE